MKAVRLAPAPNASPAASSSALPTGASVASSALPTPGSPFYEAVWNIYTEAFPLNERRSRELFDALIRDPAYRMDAMVARDAVVGMMGWWDFGSYRYVEHFAMAPAVRSEGLGGQLLDTWVQSDTRPVYLEIEDPVDEMTTRRLGFYQRHGFVKNDFEHIQQPYQGGGESVALRVLSWPEALTQSAYDQFWSDLMGRVWQDMGFTD